MSGRFPYPRRGLLGEAARPGRAPCQPKTLWQSIATWKTQILSTTEVLRALLSVGYTETHPELALNPSKPHLPDRGAQLAKGHRQTFLLKLHVACIFVSYFIKKEWERN